MVKYSTREVGELRTERYGWPRRAAASFRVRVLGFDLPVLCPGNRLHVTDSRGRGKPRPYDGTRRVVHREFIYGFGDNVPAAARNLRHRACPDAKTHQHGHGMPCPYTRRENRAGQAPPLPRVTRHDESISVRRDSGTGNFIFPSEKTGRGKPRPYDAEHDV